MYFFNLLAKISPRILVSRERNEIGQWDETTSGSRPGLGMSETLALYEVGGSLVTCLVV